MKRAAPDETGIVIYYSKWRAAGSLLLYAVLLAMCLYGLNQGKWMVLIGLPVGGWGLLVRSKELLNRQPQLQVNELGIRVEGKRLDPWHTISDEEVSTRPLGRRSVSFLRYRAGNKWREKELDRLDVDAGLLLVWLAEYRAASEAAAAGTS